MIVTIYMYLSATYNNMVAHGHNEKSDQLMEILKQAH